MLQEIEDLPNSLKSIKWAKYIDEDMFVVPSGKKVHWRNDIKPTALDVDSIQYFLGLDDVRSVNKNIWTTTLNFELVFGG